MVVKFIYYKFYYFFNDYFLIVLNKDGDWGLGIGDWGFGFW